MGKRVKMITLGYSTLSGWRKCPTYFKYRYVQKLQKPPKTFEGPPKKGSALIFGAILHEAMELWHNGEPREKVLEFVKTQGQERLGDVPESKERSAAQILQLVEAYMDHFGEAHRDFKPLQIGDESGLELEYDEEIDPRIRWRLHFDGLVAAQRDIPELGLRKGEIFILEFKTASNLAFNLRSRMFSDQAIGYSRQGTRLMAQIHGMKEEEVGALPVLFVGLNTSWSALKGHSDVDYHMKYTKRYKKEPPLLFMRELVRVQKEQHREWEKAVSKDCYRLIEDLEQDHYTRNAPDACTVFGGLCQFHDLCKICPSQRDALTEIMYEEESWKGWDVEWEEES